MAKQTTIMIGVPTHDVLAASFAQTITLCIEYMVRKGYKIIPQFWEGTMVRDARTRLMETAIAKKVDYLFFIDSDMIVRPDVIERLIRDDCDIVSTKFFRRVEPFQPCFYLDIDTTKKPVEYLTPTKWADEGILKVKATGLAATLIRRKVLEAMPDDVFYHDPFCIGEDLQFCVSAAERGFDVYVDLRLEAGHIARKVVTQHTYLMYQEMEERKHDNKEK